MFRLSNKIVQDLHLKINLKLQELLLVINIKVYKNQLKKMHTVYNLFHVHLANIYSHTDNRTWI